MTYPPEKKEPAGGGGNVVFVTEGRDGFAIAPRRRQSTCGEGETEKARQEAILIERCRAGGWFEVGRDRVSKWNETFRLNPPPE